MVTYRSLEFLGYPSYRVGDDGSVWSYRSQDVPGRGRVWRWRLIRPCRLRGGYLGVSLCRGGVVRGWSVHALVLLAFVGPCPPGREARHFPDRDPTNNRADNLSWTDKGTNQRDRVGHGTHLRGERHPLAKLNPDKVRTIHRRYGTRGPDGRRVGYGTLARELGVSPDLVRQVVKGEIWTHVN